MSQKNPSRISPYTIYERPNLKWVNLTDPSAEALSEIKAHFPFLVDMDLRDCLPPYQRPKLIVRRGYIFLVLLFPYFREDLRRVKVAEIDIFIGPGFLITSHTDELRPIRDLAKCFDDDSPNCPPAYVKAPADLLHALLDSLLRSCFPMLNTIANDISGLERRLFQKDSEEAEAVRDTLRIKTNVIDFRQAVQGHKRVMEKFISAAPNTLKLDGMRVYYEDLINHSKEIWDFLENDRNTIDAIFESFTSIISYETSQATKALSAIALVMMPATLVATVFSMRVDYMPISGHIGDWWIIVAIITTTAAVTLYFLKRMRWL